LNVFANSRLHDADLNSNPIVFKVTSKLSHKDPTLCVTPLSALALAVLAERAGVPKGVLSVVTGSASAIGGEMTSNPIVRKVTFTGSTEIGKKLMVQSASTVKRTSMELGGNAPFIVIDDADIDAAVKGAMASKYRNAGQTCVCVNRILAQDRIYDIPEDSLAKRCCNIGDRPEEDQWIVSRGNEAASYPERSSFNVKRVDDQGATSHEARGRDTALQRMPERAGANSLADPIPIGRKLSEQQVRDGVGRLTGSDRPRQT
jgi:hypothetical protein